MSENNIIYDVDELTDSDGFLGELTSDNYQSPPSDKEIARKQKQDEREYKKLIAEQSKQQKRMEKEQKNSKKNKLKWSK